MLVQSTWEVGWIALIYATALLCIPRAASTTRYGRRVRALLCMILALPVTLFASAKSAPAVADDKK